MKTLKLCLLATLAAGFLMIMSCKKGDTGPAGPAGPDSVMYSNWITLSMTGVTSGSDSLYYQVIDAKAITADIINKGSVLTYLLVSDPLSGDSSVISGNLAFEEHFLVGSINLYSPVTYTGFLYRYVVVPAKVSVTSTNGTVSTYTREQLSKMDYTTLTSVLPPPAVKASTRL